MNNLYEASNQWANRPEDERFTNLLDLKAAVDDRHRISRSKEVSLGQLRAVAGETDADLRICADGPGMGDMIPSNWAFSQLSLTSGAPSSYLRKLPASLAADCLNFSIEQQSKEKRNDLKVLMRDHGEFTQLSAVTGEKYGRIWDSEVVDLAIRIKDHSADQGKEFYNPKDWSGTPTGLYAGDRDCFIFMIDGGSMLDIGPRAQLNRGFFMWNSEVGSKVFGIKTFYFNVVCGNHIVWDVSNVRELRIRHTKNGHSRFEEMAWSKMQELSAESLSPMDSAIRAAIEYRLDDADDEVGIIKWLGRKGFTQAEARNGVAYANKEEGQCASLWDITQGLTAYARDLTHLNARTELEVKAGKLLDLVS